MLAYDGQWRPVHLEEASEEIKVEEDAKMEVDNEMDSKKSWIKRKGNCQADAQH